MRGWFEQLRYMILLRQITSEINIENIDSLVGFNNFIFNFRSCPRKRNICRKFVFEALNLTRFTLL